MLEKVKEVIEKEIRPLLALEGGEVEKYNVAVNENGEMRIMWDGNGCCAKCTGE